MTLKKQSLRGALRVKAPLNRREVRIRFHQAKLQKSKMNETPFFSPSANILIHTVQIQIVSYKYALGVLYT